MAHTPELLDALLKDCKTPEDVGALYSVLLQRVIDRSLDAEMDVHLTRDRDGSFEPQLVKKRQIRLGGMKAMLWGQAMLWGHTTAHSTLRGHGVSSTGSGLAKSHPKPTLPPWQDPYE